MQEDFNTDPIDEVIQKTTGQFDGEVYLSTDGKHTVRMNASTYEGRNLGLEWATQTYSKIVEKYGTKAQMWEKTINKDVKPNAPLCKYHNKPMTWKTGTSRTTGKPYAFWSCSERLPDGSYCDYKPAKNEAVS